MSGFLFQMTKFSRFCNENDITIEYICPVNLKACGLIQRMCQFWLLVFLNKTSRVIGFNRKERYTFWHRTWTPSDTNTNRLRPISFNIRCLFLPPCLLKWVETSIRQAKIALWLASNVILWSQNTKYCSLIGQNNDVLDRWRFYQRR